MSDAALTLKLGQGHCEKHEQVQLDTGYGHASLKELGSTVCEEILMLLLMFLPQPLPCHPNISSSIRHK